MTATFEKQTRWNLPIFTIVPKKCFTQRCKAPKWHGARVGIRLSKIESLRFWELMTEAFGKVTLSVLPTFIGIISKRHLEEY